MSLSDLYRCEECYSELCDICFRNSVCEECGAAISEENIVEWVEEAEDLQWG